VGKSFVASFDLNKYSAILFDLDSTLTDTQNYAIKACEWALKQSTPNPEEYLGPYIRSILSIYMKSIYEINNGAPYHSPTENVRKAIRGGLRNAGLEVKEDIIDDATEMFTQLHLDLSLERPGVREILETLRVKGKKLGVVTNTFEGHMPVVLEKLDLLKFFDALADPGDVKSYKPRAEIFTFVLEQLGVPENHSVYVGDEYWADVVGGKAAGLDVVWVSIRGRSLEEEFKRYSTDVKPDLIITDIADLKNFI
jgi:putative hydrolase of the HAD superfamily